MVQSAQCLPEPGGLKLLSVEITIVTRSSRRRGGGRAVGRVGGLGAVGGVEGLAGAGGAGGVAEVGEAEEVNVGR